MATNKDLLEKLDTIQEKVCNQDIEQIKGDLKETKEKISNTLNGRKFSEETRRKMSEARKRYWENKKIQEVT